LKLKRCPFCNTHDLTLDISSATFQIKCFECGAMGPASAGTIEDAARLWNEGQKDSTSMVNMLRKHTNRDDIKEISLQ
jgi:transcription elongation factor Elf1